MTARVLALGTPPVLVGEDRDHVRESQLRLARVGIETVVEYLQDGVAGRVASGRELDSIPQIRSSPVWAHACLTASTWRRPKIFFKRQLRPRGLTEAGQQIAADKVSVS